MPVDDGKLTTDHEIRVASIAGYRSSLDENIQVNGSVFLMDFTGFTMKHLTRWSLEDMKKWNNSWQVLKIVYTITSRVTLCCIINSERQRFARLFGNRI
jgi:hypothetical protein